ncbi:MAG: response regulator [Cyanobacteria bacterium P01_F01_bin.3]
MKVLVLEDDARLSDIITEALTAQRHMVGTVSDGEAGFDLLDLSPFDLVVLDLLLPGLNGVEVYRRTVIARLTGSGVDVDLS